VLVDDNVQVFEWVVDYYWLDEVALQIFSNFVFQSQTLAALADFGICLARARIYTAGITMVG